MSDTNHMNLLDGIPFDPAIAEEYAHQSITFEEVAFEFGVLLFRCQRSKLCPDCTRLLFNGIPIAVNHYLEKEAK